MSSARRNEDDGYQIVEAVVSRRALSTSSCAGPTDVGAAPTALYGVVLLMAALAYYLLQHAIIRAQGHDSILKKE